MHLIARARLIAPVVVALAGCFGEAPSVDAPGSSSGSSTSTDASSGGPSTASQTGVDSSETSSGTTSTSESTSSSTAGTMPCSTEGIVLPEGWSEWSLVRLGMPDMPPPECADRAPPIAVLLATTDPVDCACDCGLHAELCGLELLSSTAGCGVSVVETNLVDGCQAGFAPNEPARFQDVTTLAPAGNCDGPAVPFAESTPPWTVCELPAQYECDANQRVCTTLGEPAAPCPEGTEALPTAQHVECAPCGCPMSEWCTAARIDLFTDDNCGPPANPPSVLAGRGCQQNGEFRSARAGDTRLGCMSPAQKSSPRTVCCVP